MTITRECDYAIRIILMLTKLDEGDIADARTISEKQDIPGQFTLKILRRLLQAGFVRSVKGAHGGYGLAVPAGRISLYDVVSVIDGGVLINKCFGCGYVCGRVGKPETCPVHTRLGEVHQLLKEKLSEITFDALVK